MMISRSMVYKKLKELQTSKEARCFKPLDTFKMGAKQRFFMIFLAFRELEIATNCTIKHSIRTEINAAII